MESTNEISVRGILDTRRVKNSGLYPVKIRVTYKTVSKYYPVNIDLSIDDWNNMGLPDSTYLPEILSHIKERRTLVRRIVDSLSKQQLFSFDALKKEYIKHTSPSYLADHSNEV